MGRFNFSLTEFLLEEEERKAQGLNTEITDTERIKALDTYDMLSGRINRLKADYNSKRQRAEHLSNLLYAAMRDTSFHTLKIGSEHIEYVHELNQVVGELSALADSVRSNEARQAELKERHGF